MQGLIKLVILISAILFFNNMVAAADPVSYFLNSDFSFSPPDSVRVNSLESILKGYKEELNNKSLDSIELFKNIGLISAELKRPKEALEYTRKYIKNSADISILDKDSYDQISNTDEFKLLKDSYLPNINILTFIYFCIVVIGFFFAFIINFKKESDRVSCLLIGGFVAVHSIFIVDFAFYNSHLSYLYPHTFLISTSVALLYGPLLYFYFKRINQQYKFKVLDVLHLLPFVLGLFVLVPFYMQSAEEKLKFMFDLSTAYSRRDFFIYGFLLKLTSYIFYGFLIGIVYFNKQNKQSFNGDHTIIKWKRNIYYIHILYVIFYLFYGISVGQIFKFDSDVLSHTQVLAMSLMVLYIAQMAYLNPKVFDYKSFNLVDGFGLTKYLKSGLTPSLSEELKEELITLFTVDKIYRESDLNLESLSERLNTTRHNTSQIINEHFNMNFFELINKFRIDEAINLLIEDKNGNLNIIDIAYEVGYNNKVTFNKAFKKSTSLTPTQYIDSIKNR